ncbi:hypothetical protein JNK13_03215 [bacterium]|nr:hypothetical protein [bacterium]
MRKLQVLMIFGASFLLVPFAYGDTNFCNVSKTSFRGYKLNSACETIDQLGPDYDIRLWKKKGKFLASTLTYDQKRRKWRCIQSRNVKMLSMDFISYISYKIKETRLEIFTDLTNNDEDFQGLLLVNDTLARDISCVKITK